MDLQMILKLLRALFPELSFEDILQMAEERLRGRLTQVEMSQFVALRAAALRADEDDEEEE